MPGTIILDSRNGFHLYDVQTSNQMRDTWISGTYCRDPFELFGPRQYVDFLRSTVTPKLVRVFPRGYAYYNDSYSFAAEGTVAMLACRDNATPLLYGTAWMSLPTAASAYETLRSIGSGTFANLRCTNGAWTSVSANIDPSTGAVIPNTSYGRRILSATCPGQCAPLALAAGLPSSLRLHYSPYRIPSRRRGVLQAPLIDEVRIAGPLTSDVPSATQQPEPGPHDGPSATDTEAEAPPLDDADLPAFGSGGGLIDGSSIFGTGSYAHLMCRHPLESRRFRAVFRCKADATGWEYIDSNVPLLPDADSADAAAEPLLAQMPGASLREVAILQALIAACVPAVCDGFPQTYLNTLGLRTHFSQPPILLGEAARSEQRPLIVVGTNPNVVMEPFGSYRYPAGTTVSMSCPLGGLAELHSALPTAPAATSFRCSATRRAPARIFGTSWCALAEDQCNQLDTVSSGRNLTAAWNKGAWVTVSNNQTLGVSVGLPLCVPQECLNPPPWTLPSTSVISAIRVTALASTYSGTKTEVDTVCPAPHFAPTPASLAQGRGTLVCIDGTWSQTAHDCYATDVCPEPSYTAAGAALRVDAPAVTGLPTLQAPPDKTTFQLKVPWKWADRVFYPVGAVATQSCSAGPGAPVIIPGTPQVGGAALSVSGPAVRACTVSATSEPLYVSEAGFSFETVSTAAPLPPDAMASVPLPHWTNATIAAAMQCAVVQCENVAATRRWRITDVTSSLIFQSTASAFTQGTKFQAFCLEPGYEAYVSATCLPSGEWTPFVWPECPRVTCALPTAMAVSNALASPFATVLLEGGSVVLRQLEIAPPTLEPLDYLGGSPTRNPPTHVSAGSRATLQCLAGYTPASGGVPLPVATIVTDECVLNPGVDGGPAFALWRSTPFPMAAPVWTNVTVTDYYPSVALAPVSCVPARCPMLLAADLGALGLIPATASSSSLYTVTYDPGSAAGTVTPSLVIGARALVRCAPGYTAPSLVSPSGYVQPYADGSVLARCVLPPNDPLPRWERSLAADAGVAPGNPTVPVYRLLPDDSLLQCVRVQPRCSRDGGLSNSLVYVASAFIEFTDDFPEPSPFPQRGSLLSVRCAKPYAPKETQLVCGDNGVWQGQMPECRYAVCPMLGSAVLNLDDSDKTFDTMFPPSDGYSTFPSVDGSSSLFILAFTIGWPAGSKVTFSCSQGVRMVHVRYDTPADERDFVMECVHDDDSGVGHWSHTNEEAEAGIVCVAPVCDNIASVFVGLEANTTQLGWWGGAAYPYPGSRVTLACAGTTDGTPTLLRCSDDGAWQGTPPVCLPRKTCPPLALAADGTPLTPAQGGETLVPQYVTVTYSGPSEPLTEAGPGDALRYKIGTVAQYACTAGAPPAFASTVKSLYRVCDGGTGAFTWPAEAAAFTCVPAVCPNLATLVTGHHAVLPRALVPGAVYTDADVIPAGAVAGTPGQDVAVRCAAVGRPAALVWSALRCDPALREWRYNATELAQCLDSNCPAVTLPSMTALADWTGGAEFARPFASAPAAFPSVAPLGSQIRIQCADRFLPTAPSPRLLMMTCVRPVSGIGAVWTNTTYLNYADGYAYGATVPLVLGSVPLAPPEFRCVPLSTTDACSHIGSTLSNLIRATVPRVGTFTYPLVGSAVFVACAPYFMGSMPFITPRDGYATLAAPKDGAAGAVLLAVAPVFPDFDVPRLARSDVFYCPPSRAWVGFFPSCESTPDGDLHTYVGCRAPARPLYMDSQIVMTAARPALPDYIMADVSKTADYALGSTVTYSCAPGYVPRSGVFVVSTCLMNSALLHTDSPQWTNTGDAFSFRCMPAECPVNPPAELAGLPAFVLDESAGGGIVSPAATASSGYYPLGTVVTTRCDGEVSPGYTREMLRFRCEIVGPVARWVGNASLVVTDVCRDVPFAGYGACDGVPVPPNTIPTYSTHDYELGTISYPLKGSTITYECVRGTHLLAGSYVRTCGPNGVWTEEAPECVEVPMCTISSHYAGVLALQEKFVNGILVSYSIPAAVGGSRVIGTRGTLSCDNSRGFIPALARVHERAQYECVSAIDEETGKETGVWRPLDPVTNEVDYDDTGPYYFSCDIAQCPDITASLLAEFVVPTYSSPTGFTRTYPQALTHALLRCARGYAPPAEMILRTALTSLPNATASPLANVTGCDASLDNAGLICFADSLWYGRVPTCEPVTCPHITEYLIALDNDGSVLESSHFGLTTAYLDDGIRPPPPPMSSPLPPTYCDLGEQCAYNGTLATMIAGSIGTYNANGTYPRFNSLLKLSCPVGFHPATSTVRCAADGKWAGRSIKCVRVYCNAPPDSPQTMTAAVFPPGTDQPAYQAKPTLGFPAGSTAVYACRVNTTVVDATELARQRLRCSNTGTWVQLPEDNQPAGVVVPSPDVCEFIDSCPPLPLVVPLRGTQTLRTDSYDSQRTSHPLNTRSALGCRDWFAPVDGTISTLNCTKRGWTPYTSMSGAEGTGHSIPLSVSTGAATATQGFATLATTLQVLSCLPFSQCAVYPTVADGTVTYTDSRVPGSLAIPICSSASFKVSTVAPITCQRVSSTVNSPTTTAELPTAIRGAAAGFATASVPAAPHRRASRGRSVQRDVLRSTVSVGRAGADSSSGAAEGPAIGMSPQATTTSEWSVPTVQCVARYDCGPYPTRFPALAPTYSSIATSTKPTLESSRVHSACSVPRYVPDQSIVCRSDGWSSLTPCLPLLCPVPFANETASDAPFPTITIAFGGSKFSDAVGSGYSAGTEIKMWCPAPYALTSLYGAQSTCLTTGEWSRPHPRCVLYRCPRFYRPMGQYLLGAPALTPYNASNPAQHAPGVVIHTECFSESRNGGGTNSGDANPNGNITPEPTLLPGFAVYTCEYGRGWVMTRSVSCNVVGCIAPVLPTLPVDISFVYSHLPWSAIRGQEEGPVPVATAGASTAPGPSTAGRMAVLSAGGSAAAMVPQALPDGVRLNSDGTVSSVLTFSDGPVGPPGFNQVFDVDTTVSIQCPATHRAMLARGISEDIIGNQWIRTLQYVAVATETVRPSLKCSFADGTSSSFSVQTDAPVKSHEASSTRQPTLGTDVLSAAAFATTAVQNPTVQAVASTTSVWFPIAHELLCIYDCMVPVLTSLTNINTNPDTAFVNGGGFEYPPLSVTSTLAGSSLRVVCDIGYRLSTNASSSQLAITCVDGVGWSPAPPTCVRNTALTCQPLENPRAVPEGMTIRYSTAQISAGALATVRCKAGYEFSGYGYGTLEQYRTCQPSGRWSPDGLECRKQPQCLPMNVKLGVLSITYTLPNSTVYVVDPATGLGGAGNDGGTGGLGGGGMPPGLGGNVDSGAEDMPEVAAMSVPNATTPAAPSQLVLDTEAYVTCKPGFVPYPGAATLCARVPDGASGSTVQWTAAWTEQLLCIPSTTVAEARFDGAGSIVDVSFTYPTAQPVATYAAADGTTVTDTAGSWRTCSLLLSSATMQLLGNFESAGCSWLHARVLRIRLGHSFSLRPGTAITVKGGVIKASIRRTNPMYYGAIDNAFVGYMLQVTTSVRSPLQPQAITGDLAVGTTLGSCSDVTFFTRSIIGSASLLPSMQFSIAPTATNRDAADVFNQLVTAYAPVNFNAPYSTLSSPAGTFQLTLSVAEINTFFPMDTTHTFSVLFSNWLGSSATANVTVSRTSQDVPAISILSGRSTSVSAAEPVTVSPRITLSSCATAKNYTIVGVRWTSTDPAGTLPDAMMTLLETPRLALVIPSFTLPPGNTYNFRFCATQGIAGQPATQTTACETIVLYVKPQPITARLSLTPYAIYRLTPTASLAASSSAQRYPIVHIFGTSFTYVSDASAALAAGSLTPVAEASEPELDANAEAEFLTQSAAPRAAKAGAAKMGDIQMRAASMSLFNTPLRLYANASVDPDQSVSDPDNLRYTWSCRRLYRSPSLLNKLDPNAMSDSASAYVTLARLAALNALGQIETSYALWELDAVASPCFATGSEGASLLARNSSTLELPASAMATLVETAVERNSAQNINGDASVIVFFSVTVACEQGTRQSTAVLSGFIRAQTGYYVTASAVPQPGYRPGIFSPRDHLRLSAVVTAPDQRYALRWTCESGQLYVSDTLTIGKLTLATLVINSTALSPGATYTFQVTLFRTDADYPVGVYTPPNGTTTSSVVRAPGAPLPGAVDAAYVVVTMASVPSGGLCTAEYASGIRTRQTMRCYGFSTSADKLPLHHRWYLEQDTSSAGLMPFASTGLSINTAEFNAPKVLLQATRVDPIKYVTLLPKAVRVIVEIVDADGVSTWTSVMAAAADPPTGDIQTRLAALLSELRQAISIQRPSDIVQGAIALVEASDLLSPQASILAALSFLDSLVSGNLDVVLSVSEQPSGFSTYIPPSTPAAMPATPVAAQMSAAAARDSAGAAGVAAEIQTSRAAVAGPRPQALTPGAMMVGMATTTATAATTAVTPTHTGITLTAYLMNSVYRSIISLGMVNGTTPVVEDPGTGGTTTTTPAVAKAWREVITAAEADARAAGALDDDIGEEGLQTRARVGARRLPARTVARAAALSATLASISTTSTRAMRPLARALARFRGTGRPLLEQLDAATLVALGPPADSGVFNTGDDQDDEDADVSDGAEAAPDTTVTGARAPALRDDVVPPATLEVIVTPPTSAVSEALGMMWDMWTKVLAYQARHVRGIALNNIRVGENIVRSVIETAGNGGFVIQRMSGFSVITECISTQIKHFSSLAPALASLVLRGQVSSENVRVAGNSVVSFTFLRASTRMQMDCTAEPSVVLPRVSVVFNLSNLVTVVRNRSGSAVPVAPVVNDVPPTNGSTTNTTPSNPVQARDPTQVWTGLRIINNGEVSRVHPGLDMHAGSVTVPDTLLSSINAGGADSVDITVFNFFRGGALSVLDFGNATAATTTDP